jgi:hypothetical protein
LTKNSEMVKIEWWKGDGSQDQGEVCASFWGISWNWPSGGDLDCFAVTREGRKRRGRLVGPVSGWVGALTALLVTCEERKRRSNPASMCKGFFKKEDAGLLRCHSQ